MISLDVFAQVVVGFREHHVQISEEVLNILCHKDVPLDEALRLMGVRQQSARELCGSVVDMMKLIGRINNGRVDMQTVEILQNLISAILRVSQSEFLIARNSGNSGAAARELYEMCALAIPRLHRLSQSCSIH